MVPTAPARHPDEDVERELRRAFHSGDTDAFEALAAPHLDQLYTHCLRMTGNRADAEDLAQEALVRAMTNHHRYDPSRSFRPWLLTIGANLCRDRLRTIWWRRVDPLHPWRADDSPSPELQVARCERDAKVREALLQLKPKYREAVSLFHLEGLQYSELAQITGARVPALKQRVRRGLQQLERILRETYPELDPARTRNE